MVKIIGIRTLARWRFVSNDISSVFIKCDSFTAPDFNLVEVDFFALAEGSLG